MKKSKVLAIEKKAQRIMSASNGRWGDKQALQEKYKKMGIKKDSLPILYYYILEDANYHTEAQVLEDMGVFKEKYGVKQEEFTDYRKSGGRTYNIGE